MSEGPYNDRISYETSTDLVNWSDSGKILVQHASVPDAIVTDDDTINIYFVDVSKDGIKEQIGLIRSSDQGKTWSDKTTINIAGLGDKTAVDPDPFLLPDGRIRLYYFDISTTKSDPKLEQNAIYSAISEDGINFTEEEGYRLKYPAIFDPDVIKNGSNWLMYAGTDKQDVIVAKSDDGLKFNYETKVFSGGAIPNVVKTDEKYYLYTGGIEISSSADGKKFITSDNRFETTLNGITADPGVTKLKDGSYFMVYKTKPNTQNRARLTDKDLAKYQNQPKKPVV